MPTRMGSSKKAAAGDPHTLPAAVDSVPLPNPTAPYQPIADFRRVQAVKCVEETLEDIKATQTATRDRHGRIRNAKFRASVLALRWEGFTPRETAEILGVSHHRVTRALLEVRKDAALEDQMQRIDDVIVPLAIDNVARGVMNGDKEYTLRVADGRGVFRTHKSIDVRSKKQIITLQVHTVMPDHLKNAVDRPIVKAGSVVGAPALPPARLPDIPAAAVTSPAPANVPAAPSGMPIKSAESYRV